MSHAVGIDVSQGTLEVCAEPQSASRTFANTTAGIADLLAWVVPMTPTRFVFEASGGYEKKLLMALVGAGQTACRLNAQRVHHFAKALGQRAKTDPVDARVLQHFGDMVQPAATVLPRPERAQLRDLIQRRQQLITLRTGEINRSHQAESAVRVSHQRIRQALTDEIKRIEQTIRDILRATAELAALVALLSKAPGLGTLISATLCGQLPELGHYSRRAISALVGVAPMADDSGKHHGQRHIAGGRAVPRTALYQAVLSGLRHNPQIKALYLRLKARGKPSKVAMTACMRHLLCMLNAMVRDNQPWNPLPATTSKH